MARLPQPGGDSGSWGDILNDYLNVGHNPDGTLKDNSVGTTQLQDNSVTTNIIAPGAVTKTTVGLSNVDNTADTAKPVSTAQQTALNLKADTSALAAKLNTADLDTQTAAKINDNTSVTTGALKAGYIAVFTPLRYGAVGDGIADDTAAIQAALDAVPAAGGTVFFPRGTYKVSPATIRPGDGTTYGALFPKANTKMTGEGPASIILLEDGTEKVDVIYANNLANITIESLLIDGGPRLLPYWTTCVQMISCPNLTISTLEVTRGNIEGIYLYDCGNFRINNLLTHHNGAYQEDSSGLHVDTCYDGSIDTVISHTNGFHGVLFSNSRGINLANVNAHHNGWQGLFVQTMTRRCNFLNIVCSSNARGVYLKDWGTEHNQFSNVQVEASLYNGFHVYETGDNVMHGLSGISNGEHGIYVEGDWSNIAVSGTVYSGNGLSPEAVAANCTLSKPVFA